MFKMTSSLSLICLLIVAVHESQCQSSWDKFRTSFWEPKDTMICYRTVTLQLFQNLKKVIDVDYVERAETEFKSKVKESAFFSFFNKGDDPNETHEKKKEVAARVAYQGLNLIRRWLKHNCTDEKRKQIMEITKIFKENVGKCDDRKYLRDDILFLENTCPEKAQGANDENYAWKAQIHDRWF